MARWPQVRAALLLVHVVAVVLLALPSPHRMKDRARWQGQRTQREIALWAERLQGWGVDTDPKRLEAGLWDAAQQYVGLRETIAEPLSPYVAVAGVVQPWGMFRSPQRRPGELQVEVDDGHGYRLVYVSRSPEHRYLAEQLDHNRFRKIIGRAVRQRPLFDAIAGFVVERAAADFPHARRVRVTMMRFDSLPPERRAAGEEAPRQVHFRREWRR